MSTHGLRKAMMVGAFPEQALERSYERSFTQLGYEVIRFDVPSHIQKYVRFKGVGELFNRFVSVEPWLRKVARELVLEVGAHRPSLILLFGHYPVRVGALAQIKSSFAPHLVHIWPDPMQNWDTHLCATLPLLDLVGTYSDATVRTFHRLGVRQAAWVPFAGDNALHRVVSCTDEERQRYTADVSFIGSWRPEREAALMRLTDFDVKIWGDDWGRRCRGNRRLLRAWQGRGAYGEEFSKIVGCSKINLNVIDPTNYPAANMRFFELPAAGGFQLSSRAHEMDALFEDYEHLVYYDDLDTLADTARSLLADDALRQRIALRGHRFVIEEHTYLHRANQILETLLSRADPD